MQAAYPMYNQAETQPWVNQWWQALATQLESMGIDAPTQLTQPDDYYQHWLSPELLISQTCGYPLTHDLAGKVQYLITPCYDTPHNQDAYYCSLVLVQENSTVQTFADLKGASYAYNSLDSQSGYNCLYPLLAKQGTDKHQDYFGNMLASGGHRQSIAMVQSGQAETCAIDSITYALLAKHMPAAVAGLRLVMTTPLVPGLPFITSLATDQQTADKLRQAITQVQQDPAMQACLQQLLIKDWKVLELAEYDVLKR